MKKILMILAILFTIGVLVSVILTGSIQASSGNPEEPGELRDPHFHTGDWTTCMNELPRPCG
jgi:hypothetical protein